MNLIPKKFFIDDLFNDFDFKVNNDFKCDIYEKEGNYHIELDAPGIKKEDMQIEFDKGYLKIKGKMHEEKNEKDKTYIRKERYSKEFYREFYVGEIDSEKIEATFKDGIVNIIMPKPEENINKKYIEIK